MGARATSLWQLRRAAGVQTVATGFAIQAIIVVSGVLAARLLGVADRGHLALFWVLVLIVSQLATLGVPAAVTFYVAGGDAGARSVLRSLARLASGQMALSLLVHAGLLLVVLGGSEAYVRSAALLTLPVVPALVAHQYGLAMLQGRHRFAPYNAMRILPILAYSVAIASLSVAGADTLGAVSLAWSAATSVCGVGTLAVAIRDAPREGRGAQASGPSSRVAVRFGVRSMLGTFSGFDQLQLDQAVVALALSTRELGLYVVALALCNLPRLVAAGLGAVSFPAVARARSDGAQMAVLVRWTLMAIACCGAIVVALEIGAGVLIELFFGEEFREAVPLARILLIATLLQCVRRVLADSARGAGQPGLGSAAEVASWVTFVPAVLLLSDAGGLDGFGIAVCLSSAAGLALLVAGLVRAREGASGAPESSPERRAG